MSQVFYHLEQTMAYHEDLEAFLTEQNASLASCEAGKDEGDDMLS